HSACASEKGAKAQDQERRQARAYPLRVILTDFKILQRIYGANLPQGAEVHLFRGSLGLYAI
ncbi:MAG: hypothetical protein LUF28_03875, partial [Clostridiales bacterium]|nr:hypothetical protein [Clostridiales bacterium]